MVKAEISHYFKHHFIHSTTPSPPTSNRIKQNKLATYFNSLTTIVVIWQHSLEITEIII